MLQLTQLPLSLSLKDEATFDNFYADKNSEIVVELKKIARGEGERMIYLCARRGQGLSHLLQASCHYAHQYQVGSVYLPFVNLLALSPELLHGLESLQLICFDDLQVIAGHLEWEEAVFHLYNRVYDAGGRIVMAANHLPKFTQLKLADLVSRLSCGIIYQLSPLVDEEKIFVLMERAKRRGIHLAEDVAKYLLRHSERHMGRLFAALDQLDKASLAAQRRLTIPFVKEILQI